MKKLRQVQDPNYLHTVTLDELFDTVYTGSPPIVEGLLWPGTYLFVGAPKVGKSFLVAQIAYHVSTGEELWDIPVQKGTVLYLALEDDYRRLQTRLYRMFGTESTEKLHFAVCAKHIDEGLEGQLQKFVQEHPDTKLVIIDTLQKV
ncbi:MAG: AAA family ATPase, partial [Oscillospiraceae bacterium]|nr:AAA family ATPase [Oscillospiraceae bacterium]